jgi:glycerophosphoryl diester phosphodiesterase
VEIDVWPSKDGRIIVFHDETTQRFGGPDVPVYEQRFAELRAVDLGDGQRIPSLEEVLERIPAGRTLFIEVKSGPGTVAAIAEVIEANDPRPRGAKLGFQGFSLEVMRAVRSRFADAPAYWLRGAKREEGTKRVLPIDPSIVARAAAAGMTGVAIDYRGTSPELARAAEQAGLELYVWTVDDPEQVRRARDGGAAWIETNLPAMAVGALR